MRIYVAGHNGLIGSAITKVIDSREDLSWFGKNHNDLDLTDRNAVFRYLENEKPDAIIIAAAKVGGILANKKYPVDFLSQNIQISTNVMDAAHHSAVSKLIFLGSSCVYPKLARQPLTEDDLLTGPLEQTNEAYAIAKIAGIKLVSAYRKQYNRDWFSVMPTNLYGPRDTFSTTSSHVIPAVIKKFHEAKIANDAHVTLWGTGKPLREFLFSEDAAEGILHLLENNIEKEIVNLGSSHEVSISVIAQMIADRVGFTGAIRWDSSFPDGVPRKLLDSSVARALGWFPKTRLEVGIQKTYEWYLKNEARRSELTNGN